MEHVLYGYSLRFRLAAGGIVLRLIVFRNVVSHRRYNEARAHLSNIKNSLRGTYSVVLSSAIGASTGERHEILKAECREIGKQLQVASRRTSFCLHLLRLKRPLVALGVVAVLRRCCLLQW